MSFINETQGRKASVVIFRKTELKVWGRLVRGKPFDTRISNGVPLLQLPVSSGRNAWHFMFSDTTAYIRPAPSMCVPSAFLYSALILPATLCSRYDLYSQLQMTTQGFRWCSILLRAEQSLKHGCLTPTSEFLACGSMVSLSLRKE